MALFGLTNFFRRNSNYMIGDFSSNPNMSFTILYDASTFLNFYYTVAPLADAINKIGFGLVIYALSRKED